MAERPYQRLVAWKEAYELCLILYKMTRKFPSDERFALVSQIRRAASSVPINIAEGNARRSGKDKMHFFLIALGSLEELHCECLLAKDLGYLTQEQFIQCDEHICRVSFLITKLRSSFISS
ncbi:MAG: four helix bundle protein [Candidatus Peregrinibacteria bacterium]